VYLKNVCYSQVDNTVALHRVMHKVESTHLEMPRDAGYARRRYPERINMRSSKRIVLFAFAAIFVATLASRQQRSTYAQGPSPIEVREDLKLAPIQERSDPAGATTMQQQRREGLIEINSSTDLTRALRERGITEDRIVEIVTGYEKSKLTSHNKSRSTDYSTFASGRPLGCSAGVAGHAVFSSYYNPYGFIARFSTTGNSMSGMGSVCLSSGGCTYLHELWPESWERVLSHHWEGATWMTYVHAWCA
jgi:hypothetical protein